MKHEGSITHMKKDEELIRKLTGLIKETESNHVKWKIICQTTDYNDANSKPKECIDGELWTVDECFVSYECTYKGEHFLMITYEMIHSNGKEQKSSSFVFLPPLGIRLFDLHVLLPYSVSNSKMLTYVVHSLWVLLLKKYKKHDDKIELEIESRELTID